MNEITFSHAQSGAGTKPLFRLGVVVATRGALNLLERVGVNATVYLTRHQTGDFGTLAPSNLHENHMAITDGCRILSAYDVGREHLWIITEADRSSTTLLLPSEY